MHAMSHSEGAHINRTFTISEKVIRKLLKSRVTIAPLYCKAALYV